VSGERSGASRGVMREIESQLRRIDRELAPYERLRAERERLLAARAALSGKQTRKPGRVSQELVAEYLREHPGALPAEIATALEVPVTNVSAHLYRGKNERFERRADGWHVK
jgi:DNA-directed RNA polymerase specialized sigma24 family protein